MLFVLYIYENFEAEICMNFIVVAVVFVIIAVFATKMILNLKYNIYLCSIRIHIYLKKNLVRNQKINSSVSNLKINLIDLVRLFTNGIDFDFHLQ